MEILPVSVNSYKILVCLEAGIESPSKIFELTRISKDDVKASLAHLNELRLVETKGMLVFLERKLTADGVRALAVYRKVYGNDEDVVEVERKLSGED
jgi:predicted transcriptional regulator